MIIMGPGIKGGQVCHKPVELMDIYPTVLELAGLKPDPLHQGDSLKPLLQNAKADWKHVARCSFGPKNYAIISEDYHYIHYRDGSEELYSIAQDPHQWTNLALDKKFEKILKTHRSHAPTKFHEILGKRSTGHRAFEAAEKHIK